MSQWGSAKARRVLSSRRCSQSSYGIIYEIVQQPTAVFILRFWPGARGTPQIKEV
jgi:hypothetical protein